MKLFTKFFSLLVILLSIVSVSQAQISVDMKPLSNFYVLDKNIPAMVMPAFDVNALLNEDKQDALNKEIPPRFGKDISVNFGYTNAGIIEKTPDGSKIWRLAIKSSGAVSINLIFDKFYMPKNGAFFVYSKDKKQVFGAYTNANNQPDGMFSTTPCFGDEIILECNIPAGIKEEPKINVSYVIHAYKNVLNYLPNKDYGTSGACNRNVLCAEGDPYRDQIRSVAMILLANNSRWCTGSMVNNTRYDGTPFFLTANHCISGQTPSTWVFMFKYEAPACPNPGGDGPLTFSINGSTLLANNAHSDFALLKLSSKPPVSYNIYYNGWSASNVPPTSGFGVHHPDGDVKKISFVNIPFTPTSYNAPAVPGDSSHWHTTWAMIPSTGLTPITEGGSSGSPIYDQNKRVVGQLHGGPSSCTASDKSDYYGKFDRSWNYGSTPATRLKDWLDSANTGVIYVNGFDPFAGPLNAFNLSAPAAGVTVTTVAGGTNTFTFTWDTSSTAATYKWIFGSSLPVRQLTVPSPSKVLTLTSGQLDAYIAGLGVAQGGSISGSWDVWAFRNNMPNNDSLKAVNGPRTITFTRGTPFLTAFALNSPAAGSRIVTIGGSVIPVSINWTRSGSGTTYKWLYKTGGAYSDPATLRLPSNTGGFDTVLTMTLGQLDSYLAGLGLNLGDSITGYWRVRAYTSTDSLNSGAPDRSITLKRALFSSYVVSGNIVASDSTFTRPYANSGYSNTPPTSLSSSICRYHITKFRVSNPGNYYIYSGASYDNFILLYQNNFVRTSPLTNAIGGNDDTTASFMPEFTGSYPRSAVNDIPLLAGIDYLLVNTTYSASVTSGNWKDSIVGPGLINIITSTTEYGTTIPNEFKLSQNYPNPFNPVTKIQYDLPVTGFVSIKVYDVLGKEVYNLVGEEKKAGRYLVDFDGSSLGSGVYFFRMKVNSFTDTKRMILLK